jgi:hypothetical protein
MKIKIDRRFIFGMVLAIILLIGYHPTTTIAKTQNAPKKLIEYGWAAPTPNFVRQHLREMEKRPFDGVILKLNAGKEVFKKTAYPNTAFAQDRQDLAAIKSQRLSDNFVIMWSGMDDGWDWFNDADWAAAEKNIWNFAKTAKAGRFRGIAFDSEPYTGNPWKYVEQPQRANKTFPEYQRQVRKRGAQFMNTLQSAQPGTQLLTFGLLSWMKDLWAKPLTQAQLLQQLAERNYGLWPAFINGMLSAAQPSSLIIDGHEWAYYLYQANLFDAARDLVFKKARMFVEPKNARKYDKQVKLGQAVYTDLVLDTMPNNPKDPSPKKTMPHFLSPDDRLRLLEHNVYHSLRTTDRYTWFYSESADWWQNKIPPGAEAALVRAKAKIRARKPLGFDLAPAIDKALKQCVSVSKYC